MTKIKNLESKDKAFVINLIEFSDPQIGAQVGAVVASSHHGAGDQRPYMHAGYSYVLTSRACERMILDRYFKRPVLPIPSIYKTNLDPE